MRVFRQVSVFLKRHILPILAFVGGVLSCLVALMSLFQEDELTKFSRSLQSGLDALPNVESPDQGLRIVQGMEDLLRVGPMAGWHETTRLYRAKFEQQMQKRAEFAAAEAAAIEAAKQKSAAERAAAADAAAKARAAALAAQKAKEAAEAERIRAAKLAEEKRRQADLMKLRRDLAAERVCQNASCTSWIIR